MTFCKGMRKLWRFAMAEEKKPELDCPFADEEQTHHHRMRGDFPDGYPNGAVIHFTAGHTASGALHHGQISGYAFWVIDIDGTIHQTHRLDQWGRHAGRSEWEGLGKMVSRRTLGIEVVSCGTLQSKGHNVFRTWYDKEIPGDQVRHIPEQKANIKSGFYHQFTEEQEISLERLCLWLKSNNPDIFDLSLVVGHDEVSKGRKFDPGGALSCTMPDFREHLLALNAINGG